MFGFVTLDNPWSKERKAARAMRKEAGARLVRADYDFAAKHDAWWKELDRLFGEQSKDMRNREFGRGELGSELRRLYCEFKDAEREQQEAREHMNRMISPKRALTLPDYY